MKYRECIKCHELKPITDFAIEPRIVGCRHVKCRECADHDRRLFEEKARGAKQARRAWRA